MTNPSNPSATLVVDISKLGIHTQADGSDIGGVPPAKYGDTYTPASQPPPIIPPPIPASVLLYTQGTSKVGGYPAVEFHTSPLPIPANTGNLSVAFTMNLDSNVQANAEVLETDALFLIKGADGKVREFNCSLQRHVKDGELDVAGGGAGWAQTGVLAGILSPGVDHQIKITYKLDLVKNTSTVVSYECDGVLFTIPTKFANRPAAEQNWAVGAILQFQLGSNPTPADYWSYQLSNVVLAGW
jgi:hypothetical protein